MQYTSHGCIQNTALNISRCNYYHYFVCQQSLTWQIYVIMTVGAAPSVAHFQRLITLSLPNFSDWLLLAFLYGTHPTSASEVPHIYDSGEQDSYAIHFWTTTEWLWYATTYKCVETVVCRDVHYQIKCSQGHQTMVWTKVLGMREMVWTILLHI